MQRVTNYHRALHACAPLAFIVSWVVPGMLQASLMLPKEVAFNLEQMIAQRDATAAASSSAKAPSRRTTTAQQRKTTPNIQLAHPEGPGKWLFALSQAHPFPTAGGESNSGTSTSNGGTSGTSQFPVDSAAAVSLSTTNLVRWLFDEQHLALPMPPGTDLLRPPQAV